VAESERRGAPRAVTTAVNAINARAAGHPRAMFRGILRARSERAGRVC
jgi:hypothetical protein